MGTFFQLTLIRFVHQLEMQLEKYGSMHAMQRAMPTEEFAAIEEKVTQIRQIVRRKDDGRWIDWPTRMRQHGNHGKDRSEIGYFETLSSQGQFNCLTWKGLPLFKSAFDYAVLPMLLFELKPRTIVELGSGAGASAVWLSDTAKSFNLKTHIYSVDIAKPNLEYPNVTYIQGDCFAIEETLNAGFFQAVQGPILIIEDAHANVLNVLGYLHQFLKAGDYFFIEDSGPKRNVLEQFMTTHAEHYRIDTLYTDLFGKNSVSAYDSIFKKIQYCKQNVI